MKWWHQVSSLITSMGFNCIIIPYSHNKTMLSASLNKTFPSFVNAVSPFSAGTGCNGVLAQSSATRLAGTEFTSRY